MKRRGLLLRRALSALAILSGAVLIGFRGGAAAWLLFWASLIPPLLALVWRLAGLSFLRCTVRTQQEEPEHGETADCALILVNGGPLPLTDIRLRLTQGKLRFANDPGIMRFSLAPGEVRKLDLPLLCRHCGEASVGAETIWAMDPFGLSCRRLNALTQLQVRPRTARLERLLVTPPSERENRRNSRMYLGDLVPNGELRDYLPGDDLRRVNWKVSALQGSPMLRVLEPEDRDELVLLPDARAALPEGASGWTAADSVLEGTLALADHMLRRGLPLRVLPYPERDLTVRDAEGMKRLQALCAGRFFTGSARPDELMELDLARTRSGRSYVLITWLLDEAMLRRAARCQELGVDLTVIYVGGDHAAADMAAGLRWLRFYRVTERRDILTVLGGEGAAP